MRPLKRVHVGLPVTAMQTYTVASPVATHTKPAHCRDVNCVDYTLGWRMKLLADTDDERFFRRACAGQVDGYRRPHRVERDGTFITFYFEPGTPCRFITAHRATLDRPEFYTVRGGDWRGSTGLIRRHTRAEHWVEDFAGHLDTIARQTGAGR